MPTRAHTHAQTDKRPSLCTWDETLCAVWWYGMCLRFAVYMYCVQASELSDQLISLLLKTGRVQEARDVAASCAAARQEVRCMQLNNNSMHTAAVCIHQHTCFLTPAEKRYAPYRRTHTSLMLLRHCTARTALHTTCPCSTTRALVCGLCWLLCSCSAATLWWLRHG